MSKLQILVVSSAFLLFLLLFFGFNTKPKKQQGIEKSRMLQAESTDIKNLLTEAKATLDESETTALLLMEQSLAAAPGDSARIVKLKELSRKWYNLKHPEISGHYAEQIAMLTNTEEAWAIAGTTYSIGVQRATSDKVKAYCNGRAIKAFENAISINPDEVAHKINLALTYTENPPKENPMKGILMLIDLNKKNPDNVPVLTQLGRLAIKTGQYDKAVTRLERATTIDPTNARAFCLLADAYQGLGNEGKSSENKEKCSALAN